MRDNEKREDNRGQVEEWIRLIAVLEEAWDIHGVFTGYSWGIHMYRLCIGYVSVMCRLRDGGKKEQRG